MFTVADKVLMCSLVLMASGILLAAILGAAETDVEELPLIVGLFAILTFVIAPVTTVISAIWIICTL